MSVTPDENLYENNSPLNMEGLRARAKQVNDELDQIQNAFDVVKGNTNALAALANQNESNIADHETRITTAETGLDSLNAAVTAAEAARDAAQASEVAAAVSEVNAGNSEDLAQSWADENEDVEVVTGKFSAKHWAIKAELSADGPIAWSRVVDDAPETATRWPAWDEVGGTAASGRSVLGLGTAATADVQTSATDTTAGRVLLTQSGGPNGSHLNSFYIDARASIGNSDGISYILLQRTDERGGCYGTFSAGVRGVATSHGAIKISVEVCRESDTAGVISGSAFSMGNSHSTRLVTLTHAGINRVAIEVATDNASSVIRMLLFSGSYRSSEPIALVPASAVSSVAELANSQPQKLTSWPFGDIWHTGNLPDPATLSGDQTITGAKTFTADQIFNGNVGIGTSSPIDNLDIRPIAFNSNQPLGGITISDTSNGWNADGVMRIGIESNSGASPLGTFRFRGVARMQFLSPGHTVFPSGNIGIGTQIPLSKLHVDAPDPVLLVKDTDTSLTTANARLRLAESGASNALDQYWDVVADNTAGNFGFSIKQNTTTRFVINPATGNVGIGTASPVSKVDAKGSGATLVTANSSSFGSAGNGTGFGFYRSSTSRANGYSWTIESQVLDGGSVTSDYHTDSIVFKIRQSTGAASLTEVMRVRPEGNIGFGTSSPTEKLEVNGRARADQFVVDAVTALGNISGSTTINLGTSNILSGTVTGNATLSFTAPPGPCTVQLLLTNSGANNTITLPGSVTFVSGAQTEDDGAKYVLSLIFDGTNYWASWAT